MSVFDLIGLTGEATRALLAMLGTWRDVAPTIRLRLPDSDPVPLLAPLVHTTLESRYPWMLRVLDAPGAVAARGWPPHLSGAIDLALDDDVCPWNSGAWRLVLEAGEGRLESGGSGAVRMTMRGLAVWYAGAADPGGAAAGRPAGGGRERRRVPGRRERRPAAGAAGLFLVSRR